MDIKEIEKFWFVSSDDELDTAGTLFKNKKYVQSMFFLHLAVEEILKALYVKRSPLKLLLVIIYNRRQKKYRESLLKTNISNSSHKLLRLTFQLDMMITK